MSHKKHCICVECEELRDLISADDHVPPGGKKDSFDAAPQEVPIDPGPAAPQEVFKQIIPLLESLEDFGGNTGYVAKKCLSILDARRSPPSEAPTVPPATPGDDVAEIEELFKYLAEDEVEKEMQAWGRIKTLLAAIPTSPPAPAEAEYMKAEFLEEVWEHMGHYLGCTTGDCPHHDRADCETAVKATAREMAEEYLKGPAHPPAVPPLEGAQPTDEAGAK